MSTDELAEILLKKISCSHITVEDESYFHRGHTHKGQGGHYKVTLVSQAFEGGSLVQRHRAVFDALEAQMKKEIHALSAETYTPKEWEAKKINQIE